MRYGAAGRVRRRTPALVMATVLAGLAWGNLGAAKPPAGAASFHVRDQHAVLLRPRHPSRRVVVYVHAAQERARSIATDPKKRGIVRALLARGYWLAASTAHGDAWGNGASVRDYVALARVLRRRGLTRVYVLAESMGGIAGLLLVDRIRVRAWAGIFPVCSLRTVYRSETKDFKRSIRAAYRVQSLAGLRAIARGRSPVVPRNLRGLPMMMWASPRDRLVPKATNADRCARRFRRRGARVTVVTTRGAHNDPSAFRPRALTRFFGSAPR